mgnify:CR=1 FL=1
MYRYDVRRWISAKREKKEKDRRRYVAHVYVRALGIGKFRSMAEENTKRATIRRK